MSEKKDPSKMLFYLLIGIALLFVCYGLGNLFIRARRDIRDESEANRFDVSSLLQLEPKADDNYQQWG
ncbi:MAG: hypothetical protein SAL07_05920 [Oscillatoria sp. PMC 1051.18]|uniref:hypothetical protein n=1 Tax=Oscillatoria salina TaxID=331517 RepID=UPI0013BDB0E6|nr:hypothetical protein [Oscillatoria salina]MBZ8179405.1 hypothetical protein [Oscillatoria salina IIICB1]MEC4892868.1 hypothetical protein [Oscillatoria sp. PMC 1050.18]MEC5029430.1 hypothetical protein [Oscillatoria sp. PMC 1051.18]NET87856.1 hypothetical protein [Kamptonema sp. SIO1D9]